VNGDVIERGAEEATELAWRELSDVFWVVADSSDVLAPGQIAKPKEGLPWDRDDRAASADTGQLSHSPLRGGQVLEDLDARDEVDASVPKRQQSRIGLDPVEVGDSRHCLGELVGSVLDPDEHRRLQAEGLESETLSDANVNDGSGAL